jgi:hypothetical protein
VFIFLFFVISIPAESLFALFSTLSLSRVLFFLFFPGRCPGLLDVAPSGLKRLFAMGFPQVSPLGGDLEGALGFNKKSGLPCSDKPLFLVVLKLSHSATSLHGPVKSFCATTNLLISSVSFLFQSKK